MSVHSAATCASGGTSSGLERGPQAQGHGGGLGKHVGGGGGRRTALEIDPEEDDPEEGQTLPVAGHQKGDGKA